MERRKALATAGAATAAALAATIALGANLGLFGLTSSGAGPGTFEPVDATKPPPRTEVIDVPVPVTGATGGGGAASSGGAAPTAAPAAPAPAPVAASGSGDDGATVPQLEHEDGHEDEHEAPEREEPGDDD